MDQVSICDKVVGAGAPSFIIAEIGSNYNQDLDTAKKMIDIAKEAGADAVKFQIFDEKRLYPPDAGKVDYLKRDISINDIVKRAQVPNPIHRRLKDFCSDQGIIYLCTPTDQNVADYLEDIDVQAFKIASYALTHLELLKHVARKGKPILLSTGASHFHEIAEAVITLQMEGNDQIILLQCTAAYPAQCRHANIRVIDTLRAAFNVPVGISDHSMDPCIVPFAAVARGADVIEKHFTLDKSQDGPDHTFALEPDELYNMIKGIREVEQALGKREKTVEPWEDELRIFTCRSVFSTADIQKGEYISVKNTDCLRPGKKTAGIKAKYIQLLLGAQVNKNIPKGSAIQWEDVITKNQ